MMKPICATIPPVLQLYFIGQKNYFILLFLDENRMKFISNQFKQKLTLHQVCSCFLKQFEINKNAPEDSGKCSRRFRGMLLKILGNTITDSGKCSKGFRGVLLKIRGNAFNFKLIKAT